MTETTKTKRHPMYWVWADLKQRCNNPNIRNFNRYGGRGISYSPSWETFDGFCTDMLDGYKSGLSLDRIDNDKGYSKENCRWATLKTQANNTSRSRWFTINDITKTLAQWSETVNIKSSTIKQRFYVYGWSIEKSLGLIKERG
jgi:hypothetical protein